MLSQGRTKETLRIFTGMRSKAIGGAFLVLIMITLILSACADGNNPSGNTGNIDSSGDTGDTDGNGTATGDRDAITLESVIADGEDLVINIADITDKASFYPVAVDGSQMEIIAVKAPDGTIRTAFNTCQVCYDSGRGYYKQSGDKLVCQNCGNQFAMDRVEVEAGGCNPWPIFAESKIVSEESITISFDFLKASKEIFANWKQSY